MKLIPLALLAIAVNLGARNPAQAAIRPRYGGTLRVGTQVALVSIDPNYAGQSNSVSLESMLPLVFDTLVKLDAGGQAQPWLASSWQAEPGNQRWVFKIQRGVTFADGSPLNADSVAASLRSSNSKWRVSPSADTVTVECDTPDPLLPAELAQARYGIVKRDKQLRGTGPFTVKEWIPGKKLTLVARDDYWNGSPFLDSVEVEFGKASRDQLIGLDVGKLDLVEVAPDVADTSGDRRIERSAPVQWVGMVFARKPSSTDEANLREALSLSIDRQTINSVLLRGSAEDTRTLLPEWMSGYSFLFPSARNLERARQLTTESKQVGAWTLTFDSADPVLRLIADRIVLNAKDAGLTVQLLNGSAADLRLVRMLPASPDPYVALRDLLTRLGLTPPSFENISPVALYNSEKAALESQEVIPLFHLRSTVALSPVVRGWQRRSAGTWDLEKVWLLAGAP